MAFEFQILDFLQTLHTPWLNSIMLFFTRLGDTGRIWIALAILLLIFPKTRRMGVIVALSLIVELIITDAILKNMVARIRPYDVKAPLEMLSHKMHDYSFPSGHTGASFAVVCDFFREEKKRRYLWKIIFFIACMIGLSRLYLYVHFPTDVLGGACVGIIDGLIATTLVRYYESRKR